MRNSPVTLIYGSEAAQLVQTEAPSSLIKPRDFDVRVCVCVRTCMCMLVCAWVCLGVPPPHPPPIHFNLCARKVNVTVRGEK